MVHRACPLPKEQQPHRCRYCPIPPTERVRICSFYRGQLKSGVPWWRDIYRWGKDECRKAVEWIALHSAY